MADKFLDDGVATIPNISSVVPGLLEEIAAAGKNPCLDDRATRLRLLNALRAATFAIETPSEAIYRYAFIHDGLYSSIETVRSIGVFQELNKGDDAKSVASLAKATDADPMFLSRLLKHIATISVVAEVGPGLYKPTNLSRTLVLPRWEDGILCSNEMVNLAAHALPEWVKQNGRKSPTDMANTPFQLGNNTKASVFDWLYRENPQAGKHFNNYMTVLHRARPQWTDEGYYPFREQLINGSHSNAPLLVDVGGNLGNDLHEVLRRHPETAGRLVLQDLPEVIKQCKETLDSSIQTMTHDFFTEQPIKGARAYYMHAILHDWWDDKCIEILKNIAVSMTPGYSRLLINDLVLEKVGAGLAATSLDIVMLNLCASYERTDDQWRSVIASAGLKIMKIWSSDPDLESIIECELA